MSFFERTNVTIPFWEELMTNLTPIGVRTRWDMFIAPKIKSQTSMANIVFYATYIDLVQELPAEHAEVLLSGSADVYRQASNLKFNRTSVWRGGSTPAFRMSTSIFGGTPRNFPVGNFCILQRGVPPFRPYLPLQNWGTIHQSIYCIEPTGEAMLNTNGAERGSCF